MKILYKMENIIWISLISVLVYLILPLILKLIFPSYGRVISIICVLIINVIYVFIYSLFLTKKYGFSYLYPTIVAITFIPCAFVIYNIGTLVYCILYIVLGLVGSLIYFKYSSEVRS